MFLVSPHLTGSMRAGGLLGCKTGTDYTSNTQLLSFRVHIVLIVFYVLFIFCAKNDIVVMQYTNKLPVSHFRTGTPTEIDAVNAECGIS